MSFFYPSITLDTAYEPFELQVARGYPEKTDCQWQCNSSATSQVGLQIEGILVKGTNAPSPGTPRI